MYYAMTLLRLSMNVNKSAQSHRQKTWRIFNSAMLFASQTVYENQKDGSIPAYITKLGGA
ncbi:hypothetical protein SDC9_111830 [bioreactor metagenome]|uniref:Uncharacterized protein n=1 Tax=bioreactor metagenome TaxID=1076179 RepID=A0A645BIN0_9ZZZZ